MVMNLVNVGDDAGDDIAVRGTVDVSERYGLQLVESFGTQLCNRTVGDDVGAEGHQPLKDGGEQNGTQQDRNNPRDAGKIHVAGTDNQVDRPPDEDRRVEGERNIPGCKGQ